MSTHSGEQDVTRLLADGETAEALTVSSATVERDWTFAKAWLLQHLS
jgi:hypothetical protein